MQTAWRHCRVCGGREGERKRERGRETEREREREIQYPQTERELNSQIQLKADVCISMYIFCQLVE